jgi:hypothetical protein
VPQEESTVIAAFPVSCDPLKLPCLKTEYSL